MAPTGSDTVEPDPATAGTLGDGECMPPGRTGWSFEGSEKEAERDEEVDEGRRALLAVF